jgi:hypothetical protein
VVVAACGEGGEGAGSATTPQATGDERRLTLRRRGDEVLAAGKIVIRA